MKYVHYEYEEREKPLRREKKGRFAGKEKNRQWETESELSLAK